MARALVTIRCRADRDRLKAWIDSAPDLSRVELKGPARTGDQNALMWELLTQLAVKFRWHGMKLSPDDYKDLISAGLKREVRMVPNIDGTGFVSLGQRTSDMSVPEMSDLIELIYAFAAREGVTFSAPPSQERAA